MNNYYKDLWTNPKTEAGQFFNKVDFNHQDYKDQEKVFRNFLKGLKRLKEVHEDQKPIESVLEVGAGTGRMAKIMLEELPDIKMYDMVDIRPFNEPQIKENLSSIPNEILKQKEIGTCFPMDITKNSFSQTFSPSVVQYDAVLASEVFMHIKPSDLEKTMKRLIDLLTPQGVIINIDWATDPMPSNWCYIHNYDQIYRDNGLFPVFMMDVNKQKLFCYGK